MRAAPSTPAVLAATARMPAHVVYREFPAEVVLLNLQTGRYHGLNPTAGRMLRALEERGLIEVERPAPGAQAR